MSLGPKWFYSGSRLIRPLRPSPEVIALSGDYCTNKLVLIRTRKQIDGLRRQLGLQRVLHVVVVVVVIAVVWDRPGPRTGPSGRSPSSAAAAPAALMRKIQDGKHGFYGRRISMPGSAVSVSASAASQTLFEQVWNLGEGLENDDAQRIN